MSQKVNVMMEWIGQEQRHSMIGRERMNQLQEAMETVVRENIEGDFIETGVWRGGSCIFMNGFTSKQHYGS